MILSAQHSMAKPSPWHRRALTVAIVAITASIGVLIPRVDVTAMPAPPRFERMLEPAPVPVLTGQAVQPTAPRQTQPPADAATVPVSTGIISGTIRDTSGAVIPGVRITVNGGQVATSTITNPRGAFTVRDLPSGRYRLEASAPDFTPVLLNFDVRSGSTSNANLTLTLAVISTIVQVSVDRPSLIAPPPAPAGPPSVPPPPLRVGGDVAVANLITQVNPIYPAASRAAGIEGDVVISATIDKGGQVINARVVNSADRNLSAAALEAVQQWRYKPTLLNGQPIDVVTSITVNFSMAP